MFKLIALVAASTALISASPVQSSRTPSPTPAVGCASACCTKACCDKPCCADVCSCPDCVACCDCCG